MKRIPRSSYRSHRYPPWCMDRRGFLRRIGGAGGLLVLGATPLAGRALAEVLTDEDVHVLWLPWSHGSRSVDTEAGLIDYQLEIGVHSDATAACIEEAAGALLEDVDAMLADPYCKLPLFESGSFTDYPLVVELLAAHCPAQPGPGDEDDSAAGAPESTDEEGYAFATLWWHVERKYYAGLPAEPDCLCRVPTRRRRR